MSYSKTTIHISGTVRYQNLGMGFWGIIDNNGKEWRPIHMPEQLKLEGAKVEVKAQEIEEEMSMFMWGTPIKIISFSTLSPA